MGSRMYRYSSNILHFIASESVIHAISKYSGSFNPTHTEHIAMSVAANLVISSFVEVSKTLYEKAVFNAGVTAHKSVPTLGTADVLTGTYLGDSLMTFGYDIEPGIKSLSSGIYRGKDHMNSLDPDQIGRTLRTFYDGRNSAKNKATFSVNAINAFNDTSASYKTNVDGMHLLLDLGASTTHTVNSQMHGNLFPVAKLIGDIKDGFSFDDVIGNITNTDIALRAELDVPKVRDADEPRDCYMYVPVYDVYTRPDGTTYRRLNAERTASMTIKYTPQQFDVYDKTKVGSSPIGGRAINNSLYTPTDATAALKIQWDPTSGKFSFAHDLDTVIQKGKLGTYINNLDPKDPITLPDGELSKLLGKHDMVVVRTDPLPMIHDVKKLGIAYISADRGTTIFSGVKQPPADPKDPHMDYTVATGGIPNFHGMDIRTFESELQQRIKTSGLEMLPSQYRPDAFSSAYHGLMKDKTSSKDEHPSLGQIVTGMITSYGVAQMGVGRPTFHGYGGSIWHKTVQAGSDNNATTVAMSAPVAAVSIKPRQIAFIPYNTDLGGSAN